MNRVSAKLLSVLALFLFLAIMPIAVFATNEDVSIVSTVNVDSKTEYIIYIKDYSNKKFKYAFTTNANPEEMDLNYINSTQDLEGNQVAFLSAETYEKLLNQSSTIYIWAKDEEENLVLKGIQLDLKEALTKENLEEVEKLTQKIKVEIATSKDITNSTNPVRKEDVEGVTETSKAGYIKITDDPKASYYYQRIELPNTTEYNDFMELVNEVEDKYDSMNMYEKVIIAKKINNVYNKLLEVNNWQEVENMEIKQPESSIQGNGMGKKYIVFLKKVAQDGNITTDAQFLQEYYDYEPNVEKEEVIIQETTKLPITYDSIALFVVLGIIALLIILVAIRMKKLSKQNEQK